MGKTSSEMKNFHCRRSLLSEIGEDLWTLYIWNRWFINHGRKAISKVKKIKVSQITISCSSRCVVCKKYGGSKEYSAIEWCKGGTNFFGNCQLSWIFVFFWEIGFQTSFYLVQNSISRKSKALCFGKKILGFWAIQPQPFQPQPSKYCGDVSWCWWNALIKFLNGKFGFTVPKFKISPSPTLYVPRSLGP